jgi:hypothetical protein
VVAGLNGTEHDDISRIEVHKSALAGENPDWMVAHAVTCEPVSTPKFPVNREKNRECCRIRPLSAIVKADTRTNSEACSEIPYATEQGNILVEQGILAEEQGPLPAKTKIGAGRGFRYTQALAVGWPPAIW